MAVLRHSDLKTGKPKSQFVLALVAALALGSSAWADRYLVVMKDKKMFAQAHRQVQAGVHNSTQIQIEQMGTPFAKSGVQVQDSLKNLQALVIEAETSAQVDELEKTGLVAFTEKEVFFPAPKPIGMEAAAWSFDLSAGLHSAGELAPTAPASFLAEPDKTPWGVVAINAPLVWNSGNQGEGARVLVLDSGIDQNHPAVKANFEQGRDFVGDGAAPYPYADNSGHGTHCSGTIAGVRMKSGFAGVAPKARLLMGRVCSEVGCSTLAITAGMNWAIEQKVDVVSMSLSGPLAMSSQIVVEQALEAAGIVVVAASGNDGTGTVGYPAADPTVVAVGAVDKTLTKASFSQWGYELALVAPGVEVVSSVPVGMGRDSVVLVNQQTVTSTSFAGAPEVRVGITNQLVFSGLGRPEDFTEAVKGKFALIGRGEIKFVDKVKNAIEAGASGVVFFNNTSGLVQGSVAAKGATVTIPVVMVEKGIGEQAKALLDQGQVVDVTIQTTPSDYASYAGTSMATPHVAGVVALMKSANHNLKPEQVRNILRSSATPHSPNPENQYGSGFLNAEKAVRMAKATK